MQLLLGNATIPEDRLYYKKIQLSIFNMESIHSKQQTRFSIIWHSFTQWFKLKVGKNKL